MSAPGGLTELGEHALGWDERVAEVVLSLDPPANLTEADRAGATELRVLDWPAVPVRARACLGVERADRLCDARVPSGVTGRALLQEEYAEWRVVHDEDGPTRFELTTELADYWLLLARHRPERLVELVAGFARRPSLTLTEVFGDLPMDQAFATQFMASPFNNGELAITCLSRGDNSLRALVNLVAGSAVPLQLRDRHDGELRFPSGSEAIPALRPGAAQDCRASDPLVAERIVRVATEGRPIRFDDPIGVYIAAVQTQDLLDPDGEPIPDAWVKLTRQGRPLGDGLARHQRLELEVPPDAGFKLSDLVSRRTGERVRWGAHIAELVELAVYVRVGEPGTILAHARMPSETPSCADKAKCQDLEANAAALEDSG